MPVMDGVEATKKLREMGYSQPIVALTANAVAGQANIFLGNGFDDYISKPIDIRHLNNILNKYIRNKWLPDSVKAVKQQVLANKDQIGEEPETNPELDPMLVKAFVRDALKSLSVLEEYVVNGCPDGDDLRTFVIHAHGLKSALVNVGKMDLSAVALRLEHWGKNGDLNAIISETPEFLASLRAFVEGFINGENRQYAG